ncbi:Probable protein phosphatase 2C 55 [Linum grandiflorum]
MPSGRFSKLRTAVQNGIQRSFVGHQHSVQESIDILIGQSKFQFCNYKLLHSVRIASLTDLQLLCSPGVFSTAGTDSLLLNKERNISVVGALSRMFSVPSVSGPSFQAAGYHIDRAVSDPSAISVGKKLNNNMAASAQRMLLGENLTSRGTRFPCSTNSKNIAFQSRSPRQRGIFRMSSGRTDQHTNVPVYRYLAYNVVKKLISPSIEMAVSARHFHSSSSSGSSARMAPDVNYDSSNREEKLDAASDSSEAKLSGRSLKLLSGSCCLPHPDKEETGGEDAHFICSDQHAIGVADGVGGWADLGVDAGQYSRELMSHSVNAIREEPKGSVDPARVLEKAHSSTKAKGSSTACIIALTEEGLRAINLGDSGFMVVRDGHTVVRSPVQQHDFNFTFQLESGNNGDLPSSGQVFTVAVAPGDVIVAGTDGLFDNLYNNEITAVVVHAVRAGLEPQVTAQKIAALARQRAQEKDRQTPFSTAAQDAGFRYYGGKLDDITVVVSYIRNSNEEQKQSC